MPLSFLAASDGSMMLFVNPSSQLKIPANSDELLPGHTYDVFLFLQNTDEADYDEVMIEVWHSTFGIGLRDWTSGIVQPQPVILPGSFQGAPGVVAIRFSFTTPMRGMGYLAAKVLPSGPAVTQRVRIAHEQSFSNSGLLRDKDRGKNGPRIMATWCSDHDPT